MGLRGGNVAGPSALSPVSGLPSSNPMGLVQHDEEHDGGYGSALSGKKKVSKLSGTAQNAAPFFVRFEES